MSNNIVQGPPLRAVIIAPSILSADFGNLARDVRAVEKAGAQWLHIDVMDGHFVPNLTIGPVVVKALRPHARLLFDVHLMIERPDRYWEAFKAAGADLITFHGESPVPALPLIRAMRAAGLKVGVSIKPKSDERKYLRLIPHLDLVLVMTVEPGFGGQKFMDHLLPRVSRFRAAARRVNPRCLIEVDGGINRETAVAAAAAGAQVLVAGQAVFGTADPGRAVKSMLKAIDNSKKIR